MAETALAIARQKAAERGIELEFAAADAFQLGRLGCTFKMVPTADCSTPSTAKSEHNKAQWRAGKPAGEHALLVTEIYKDRRVCIIIECPEIILHLDAGYIYADCPFAQLQTSCSPAADHNCVTSVEYPQTTNCMVRVVCKYSLVGSLPFQSTDPEPNLGHSPQVHSLVNSVTAFPELSHE